MKSTLTTLAGLLVCTAASAQVNQTQTIVSSASEALRITGANGYVSGFTTDNVTRNGFLQYQPGLMVLASETGNKYITLNPNGGNVGIGTSVPTSKLTVLGDAHFGSYTGLAYTKISWNAIAGTGASTFDNHRDQGGVAFIFRSASTPSNTPAELMRITGAGNVAIGNTAPAAKLDVTGNAIFSSYLKAAATHLGKTTVDVQGAYVNWNDDGGSGSTFLVNQIGNGGGGGFVFQESTTANARTELMRITPAGNVGIGTSAPANKLQVNGNMGLNGVIYMSGGTLYSDANNMASLHNGGFVWANAANSANKMILSSTGNLVLYGNMDIGTTLNKRDLNVNGNIKTRKVTVTQTNWPDYVFDSSYQLRPLSQVEQFLKENKHLPEVPSAATIEKEGLNMGDNQAVLLKKIEELTLYIIEQHKEMQEMKKEIKALKNAR